MTGSVTTARTHPDMARHRLRPIVLALGMAGVSFSVAQAETIVATIHPNRLDVGEVSLDVLVANPLQVCDEATIDMEEAREVLSDIYDGYSVNEFARELLADLDTLQTHLLMQDAMQLLGLGGETGSQIMHMEDGSRVVMGGDEAFAVSVLCQELVSARLSERDQAEIPDGPVVLSVKGVCPFEGGPAHLSDLGIAVEFRRDQVPLLFCVPGDSRVYCLASEPTRVTAGPQPSGLGLSFGFGERGLHSEIYEADIGAKSWPLRGANWGDCAIDMNRP